MSEWSIYIEAWAPESKPGSVDATDARVNALVDSLAPMGGVVTADSTRWTAQITMTGTSAVDVVDRGVDLVAMTAAQCRLPQWSIERVEVVEVDRRDTELEVSNFPDVVGTTEVAELLGVTRQRIHELRKADRFPEPMVELAAGPIWLKPAIVAFDERWERKAGRPSNEAKWTKTLVDDYYADIEKMRDEPQKEEMWRHEADLKVHQLVSRHGIDVAATVLGLPADDVKAATGRPGLS